MLLSIAGIFAFALHALAGDVGVRAPWCCVQGSGLAARGIPVQQDELPGDLLNFSSSTVNSTNDNPALNRKSEGRNQRQGRSLKRTFLGCCSRRLMIDLAACLA